MNIDKLYAGKVFKNYKVLCSELGLDIKSSNHSKLAQFKELARYCNFKKIGHTINIAEVYTSPVLKIDNRGKSPGSRNNAKKLISPLTITNPLLATEWLVEKNGMEIPKTLTRRSNEEYWWKCSRCCTEILSSPNRRLKNEKNVSDKSLTCPYCSLSKGAKKIYRVLDHHNIKFQKEFQFSDLIGTKGYMLRFDFAVFNESNELVSLVEFDGQYHDEKLNTDPENYRILKTHDKLKDEYCRKNSIPLLRIHHTDVDNVLLLLVNFFQGLEIELDKKEALKFSLSQLINYKNEKNQLHNRLLTVEKEIARLEGQ